MAVGFINEAIDRGDPIRTIETLLLPTAKLQNIKEANACHYQAVLNDAKTRKCQVDNFQYFFPTLSKFL